MIRVAVFGAAGKMGSTVCAAVDAADGMELAAAADPSSSEASLSALVPGLSPGPAGIAVAVAAEDLDPSTIDVAVDFTVASAARENLAWCAANGVHAVCGTTGLGEDDLQQLAKSFGPGEPANAVVAANFSIGAVLMMRCAEMCAPYFAGIEIIELHHDKKRDAPSGTSLATAERMERARQERQANGLAPDPTERAVLEGTRGGTRASGIHIHSVRLPGLVAHQEVLFGAPGEMLTLRHDSTDRVSFMPGVLLAVRMVADLDGLTLGLDRLLGL